MRCLVLSVNQAQAGPNVKLTFKARAAFIACTPNIEGRGHVIEGRVIYNLLSYLLQQ